MIEELVAPCGMNCAVCSGYLALKYDVKSRGIRAPYCEGCRPRGKKCAFLKKRCKLLLNDEVQFCYECKDFPCEKLRHIDKRYRTFFRVSLIENLEDIKKGGVLNFLREQEEKWKCPECGGEICCHNGVCYSCGLEKLKDRKRLFRWEDD